MVRLVALAAVLWVAAAPARGAEWAPVAEDESRIVFAVSGLSAGAFYKRDQPWGNEARAFWRGAGGMPRAEIYLLLLSPNRIIRTDHDLAELTGQWRFLDARGLAAGEMTAGVVGGLRYLRFGGDDLHCVSFLRAWGSSAIWDNDRGVPPNHLTGYYCDRQPLSDATVKAILGAIGVRGYGVPERALAGPIEALDPDPSDVTGFTVDPGGPIGFHGHHET